MAHRNKREAILADVGSQVQCKIVDIIFVVPLIGKDSKNNLPIWGGQKTEIGLVEKTRS